MKKLVIVLCSILCLMMCSISLHAKEDFNIASKYAILLNLEDDEVIYEKNSEEQMYPASMTKVMTVLTALDYLDDLQKKLL